MHHFRFHRARHVVTELTRPQSDIWSVIQQRVYETRVHDIDELRQCLLYYMWHSLEQLLIDDAVDQW